MPLLSLDTHDPVPLTEQIVRGLRRQIDDWLLRPGARLPSIRAFAKDHGVSCHTVVQAYDRLVAAGCLNSRLGSGFYVADANRVEATESTAYQPKRAIDVLWLLHRSIRDQHHRYLPGCGWLPPEWLDQSSLQRGLRALGRETGADFASYGGAAGYLPLREQLQRRLAQRGITAATGQIMTTHGVSHAIDLVARYLLSPGDKVLVDDPGYFATFGYLQSLGVHLVGVPWQTDGPDTTVLEGLLKEHRPKAFFTNTILHNPTATSISQSCAHRVLRLAERYGLIVVEDDVYADFQLQPGSRLASLDQLDRVIYVGSFSKTLSASVRVGYLAANEDTIRALLDLKLLSGLTTSLLGERLVCQVLSEGHYRKHLTQLQGKLRRARERTLRNLQSSGFTTFVEPLDGHFIWARLQGMDDSAALATSAEERGIMLAPGRILRPHQQPSPWLRFNVAFSQNRALFQAIEEAAAPIANAATE